MNKRLELTTWNKIFKFRQLASQRARDLELIKNAPKVIKKINNCKSLMELFECHKWLWNLGYQNENIGPCPYGMFRTNDIRTMRPSEVFLGDIYGLHTKNIPDWLPYLEEEWGEGISIGELLMEQYQNHLISNVNAIEQHLRKYV